MIGLVALEMNAQTMVSNDSTKLGIKSASQVLTEWNTERMLDSLDQEKLPKKVTCGILAGANINNFLITRDHHTMHSHMRIGAELGGFVDFRITKNFTIQPQVVLTAQQNHFSVKDTLNISASDTTNHLWSFGIDIPIYFLGRFGNMRQGYIQFGGGIFTHFTFASNTGKYKPVDNPCPPQPKLRLLVLPRLLKNPWSDTTTAVSTRCTITISVYACLWDMSSGLVCRSTSTTKSVCRI